MFDVFTLIEVFLFSSYFHRCNCTCFFSENTDDCISFLLRIVCSYNLVDCEVTGEIRLSSSTHLLAGHLASHLKKEKKNTSLSDVAMIYLTMCLQCNQNQTQKQIFCWCTLTNFIEIHPLKGHIIFGSSCLDTL